MSSVVRKDLRRSAYLGKDVYFVQFFVARKPTPQELKRINDLCKELFGPIRKKRSNPRG
jgi:hypothetical protein